MGKETDTHIKLQHPNGLPIQDPKRTPLPLNNEECFSVEQCINLRVIYL